MAEVFETPILVRDFAEDPKLGLEVVVEGDLNRPVSRVHVTELLDPSPYVEGGGFILSPGVWDARGVRVDTFVGALAGAVALRCGLLAEDEIVPAAVVRACRSAGLALLAVPTRTQFIAIVRRFVEHVQSRREASLRATIERNERLVGAITGLSGGLRGILGVLHMSVPRNTWVLGEDGRMLAANTAEEPPAQIVAEVRAGRSRTETPVGDAVVFGVGASGRATAYLVVEGTRLTVEQRAAIGQALPLLGFVVDHEHGLREVERRLATEFVDAVLSGRTQFSAGRLRAYGLDPYGPLTGVVATTTSEPEAVLGAAKRALGTLGGDAVVATYRDTVTAIVQPLRGEPTPDAIGGALYAALGPGSAVGVGCESADAEGLRRSLIQARQAANLARRRKPGGYATYDAAESHALLLALQDEDVLASFCASLLGPIEEYDVRRGAGLLPTLEAFLASGGQWQATADRLHVHVNTLRHRLARCEELTGRNLISMEDRVDFYIAIRARDGL